MTLSDVWDMILNNFLGFLLIMCRVSGIFSFNPIFSRSNFPVRLESRHNDSACCAVCLVHGEYKI